MIIIIVTISFDLLVVDDGAFRVSAVVAAVVVIVYGAVNALFLHYFDCVLLVIPS